MITIIQIGCVFVALGVLLMLVRDLRSLNDEIEYRRNKSRARSKVGALREARQINTLKQTRTRAKAMGGTMIALLIAAAVLLSFAGCGGPCVQCEPYWGERAPSASGCICHVGDQRIFIGD